MGYIKPNKVKVQIVVTAKIKGFRCYKVRAAAVEMLSKIFGILLNTTFTIKYKVNKEVTNE